MQQRTLGNTALMVSVLGLGTVKIGRTRGLKYPGAAATSLPDDAQVMHLCRAAEEVGINVIDTAPAYGVSEERLGKLMATLGWLGGRERWIVVSKAGEEFDDAHGTSRFDFSAAAVRASIERSLKRLRIDALDVALLHSDGRDEWVVNQSGGFEALEMMKKEGKVRAIGVSSKSVAGGVAAIERGSDVVMATLNAEYRDELAVITAARARGVGVLVKKALGSGHVRDPAAALRMVVQTEGVGCAVVGTTSAANLRANAEAVK